MSMSESNGTSTVECKRNKNEINSFRDHEHDDDEVTTRITELALKNPNKCATDLLNSISETEQNAQNADDDFNENGNIVPVSESLSGSDEDQNRSSIIFSDIAFDPNYTVGEVYEELRKVVKLEQNVAELETTVQKKDQEIVFLKNQLKEQKAKSFFLKYQLEEQNQKLKTVNVETTNAPQVTKRDQKSQVVEKSHLLDSKASSVSKKEHPSLLDLQSEKISIHKDLAGAIIGPFGSRIRAIRTSSNATIVIGEEILGKNKRTITITGTPQQIENAKVLLYKSARENTVC